MSTTFSVTMDQLATSALRLQGYIQQGQTPNATILANMREAANVMIKAWSSKGLKVWCVQEVTIPLTTMPRLLELGPTAVSPPGLITDRPLRIEECFIRYNPTNPTPTDVSLQPLSRNEYAMLGNKFTTGTPNSYYYDQQIPNGILYIYTQPDLLAAGFEIHIFRRKQLDDISAGGSSFNFPSEWYQALRWGLADETSLDNQIPEAVADRISQRAKRLLDEMEDWDREYTSVYFQPDMRRSGR